MRFSTSLIVVSTLALATALLAGCAAPGMSGDTYQREQSQRAQSVEYGVVESVRNVKIEGTKSGVGTVGGAVAGGALGSTIGGGSGRVVAAVGGAILGGLAGSKIEEETTKREGIEITVRLDGGRTLAVVQEATESFRTGERVRVLSDGQTTRVTR